MSMGKNDQYSISQCRNLQDIIDGLQVENAWAVS